MQLMYWAFLTGTIPSTNDIFSGALIFYTQTDKDVLQVAGQLRSNNTAVESEIVANFLLSNNWKICRKPSEQNLFSNTLGINSKLIENYQFQRCCILAIICNKFLCFGYLG